MELNRKSLLGCFVVTFMSLIIGTAGSVVFAQPPESGNFSNSQFSSLVGGLTIDEESFPLSRHPVDFGNLNTKLNSEFTSGFESVFGVQWSVENWRIYSNEPFTGTGVYALKTNEGIATYEAITSTNLLPLLEETDSSLDAAFSTAGWMQTSTGQHPVEVMILISNSVTAYFYTGSAPVELLIGLEESSRSAPTMNMRGPDDGVFVPYTKCTADYDLAIWGAKQAKKLADSNAQTALQIATTAAMNTEIACIASAHAALVICVGAFWLFGPLAPAEALGCAAGYLLYNAECHRDLIIGLNTANATHAASLQAAIAAYDLAKKMAEKQKILCEGGKPGNIDTDMDTER